MRARHCPSTQRKNHCIFRLFLGQGILLAIYLVTCSTETRALQDFVVNNKLFYNTPQYHSTIELTSDDFFISRQDEPERN